MKIYLPRVGEPRSQYSSASLSPQLVQGLYPIQTTSPRIQSLIDQELILLEYLTVFRTLCQVLVHISSHFIPTTVLGSYPLFQYVKNEAQKDGKLEILPKSIGSQIHYFPTLSLLGLYHLLTLWPWASYFTSLKPSFSNKAIMRVRKCMVGAR